MAIFACWWWWLLLGGLLGWLASWWLSRRAMGRMGGRWQERNADSDARHLAVLRDRDAEAGRLRGELEEWRNRPAPQPQVRVVEKIIEKPVDRVVEKLVDNPEHLRRVRSLEAEVSLIPSLRSQLLQLQSAAPKIIEKVVDRPVDRIVEKIVEKPVEKIVYQQVDNPRHLIRVRELEAQVGVIAGLRSQLQTLQSAPPSVVEKVIEKIIDRPVERIVQKVVEKRVDNPVHLRRLRELEAQVALIAGLRSQVQSLQSAPPKLVEKVVEKIVEKPVDRIIEKIVERPVDRIVERLVPDTSAIEERDRQLSALRQQCEALERAERERIGVIAARDEQIRLLQMQTVHIDAQAAKAAGFTVRGMNELELIEGIGPKIAALLNDAGVHYFHELARMQAAQIQLILDKAGPNYQLAKPDTWPEQASLAANNRWTELRRLQDELIAGNRR